jgi:hypothetical protein
MKRRRHALSRSSASRGRQALKELGPGNLVSSARRRWAVTRRQRVLGGVSPGVGLPAGRGSTAAPNAIGQSSQTCAGPASRAAASGSEPSVLGLPPRPCPAPAAERAVTARPSSGAAQCVDEHTRRELGNRLRLEPD